MFRSVVLLAVVAALAGCAAFASYDKQALTQFQPVAGGFKYQAPAGGVYPLDTPGGEKQRMDWLGEYLADNHLCPAGYLITSRQVVLKAKGLLATSYDVFYEGRCN